MQRPEASTGGAPARDQGITGEGFPIQVISPAASTCLLTVSL